LRTTQLLRGVARSKDKGYDGISVARE
jgi:hypothetical protein